jgi:WD40 repeat protein
MEAEEDETGAMGAPVASKRWKMRNPYKTYREYRKRKKVESERVLLIREEHMMEDLERYLMEIEEQRCWKAYQLNHLNYQRIKKKEIISRVERNEKLKDSKIEEERLKENGLSFFQGNVQNYQRWQNSPAKFKDFVGHKESVTSCKFSPDLSCILSCSEDNTMRLWLVATGNCVKVCVGHAKVVNDADFHPILFKLYSQTTCLVSCSGDGTLRLWNTSKEKPIATIHGHTNAVYRVGFSPDGDTIISCSEDKTIRTWNFPEGFNLYTYRAHNAPVISVRYSYSGKYFVSGSDYGERKILLWDAKLPNFTEPSKFPHILF